jgi:WD40 repeat protein
MDQYSLKKIIQKHYDSINALAFSPDGSLFASAADDGLIIIFQGNGSGREVCQFQVKAPVTTLLWRSRFVAHWWLVIQAVMYIQYVSIPPPM